MKMSNKHILFIIYFILSFIAYSKEYSINNQIPKWITNNKTERIKKSPENITNGIYYLLFDKQTNVLDKKHTFYNKISIQVFENEGIKNVSQINLDFNPSHEHVTLHSINIIRGNKTIKKINNSKISILQRELELSLQKYDGTKTINIILDDIRVNDILEYSYSITGSNPVFNNKYFDSFDLQWSIPVKRVYYRLLFPRKRKLFIKKFNTEKEYVKNMKSEYTEYIWDEKDTPALNYDDYIPYWYFPQKYIQVSEFKEWNDIVEWGIDLFNIKDNNIDDIMKNFNHIKFSTSKYQNLIHVLRFVQKEIRYMGIEMGKGAYTPRKPSIVYNQRFGDCKDKALLMVKILNNLGIEAYPAFVNTYLNIQIKNYLPSPLLFDHVIVLAKIDDKNIWLDPTIEYQEGNLNYFDEPYYGYALVLSRHHPYLVKMNQKERTKPDKQIFESFLVSNLKENKAVLDVKTVLTKNEANYIRSHLSYSGENQLKKDFLNYYATYYPEIKNTDFKVEDDTNINTIKTNEKYEISKIYYYDAEQKKYYLQFCAGDIQSYLVIPQVKKRTMPLNLYHPINISYNYSISVAEPYWNIKNDEIIIKNSFVDFKRTIKYNRKKKQISIDFSYKTLKDYVDISNIDNYITDIDNISDFLTVTVYKKNFSIEILKARINLIIIIIVCIAVFFLIIRAINKNFLITLVKKVINIFKKKSI